MAYFRNTEVSSDSEVYDLMFMEAARALKEIVYKESARISHEELYALKNNSFVSSLKLLFKFVFYEKTLKLKNMRLKK